MQEIERRKMSKNGKTMLALMAPHMRALVDLSNEIGIKREDIVTISKSEEGVTMIYYG